MATDSRVREMQTLEDFLDREDLDDKPYLLFLDGRVEVKVSPKRKHSKLTIRFSERLNRYAEPAGLGFAYPEPRCTFGGQSLIPDVAFLLQEHITLDQNGEEEDETLRPPDIHVEIISPRQSVKPSQSSLAHSATHGCPLGLLVHPKRKTIHVYRPGRPPEPLAADGVIEGDPVLPGFRLPVAEVFGWLKGSRPEPTPGDPPS